MIGSVSEAPQVPQNRASTAFEAPQAGHRSPSAAPHEVQYRWSAAFIAEHDWADRSRHGAASLALDSGSMFGDQPPAPWWSLSDIDNPPDERGKGIGVGWGDIQKTVAGTREWLHGEVLTLALQVVQQRD